MPSKEAVRELIMANVYSSLKRACIIKFANRVEWRNVRRHGDTGGRTLVLVECMVFEHCVPETLTFNSIMNHDL